MLNGCSIIVQYCSRSRDIMEEIDYKDNILEVHLLLVLLRHEDCVEIVILSLPAGRQVKRRISLLKHEILQSLRSFRMTNQSSPYSKTDTEKNNYAILSNC